METPLLSVCLITYNHVNYIKQAIDGVLMQNVTFTWELIIADDFSTDGTREILLYYKIKYPDFITLILQEKNVGAAQNWIDLITYPKSKYIAYFEGDDYWTDPYKLQKQVDVLESNPECSQSFHNTLVSYQDKSKHSFLICSRTLKNFQIFSTTDLINYKVIIPTSSMVFRTIAIKDLPDWINKTKAGEKSLQLLISLNGSAIYIKDVMSVYRANSGGVSYGQSLEYALTEMTKMYNYFNESTNGKFNTVITIRISKMNRYYKNTKMINKYGITYFAIRPDLAFGIIKRRFLKYLRH